MSIARRYAVQKSDPSHPHPPDFSRMLYVVMPRLEFTKIDSRTKFENIKIQTISSFTDQYLHLNWDEEETERFHEIGWVNFMADYSGMYVGRAHRYHTQFDVGGTTDFFEMRSFAKTYLYGIDDEDISVLLKSLGRLPPVLRLPISAFELQPKTSRKYIDDLQWDSDEEVSCSGTPPAVDKLVSRSKFMKVGSDYKEERDMP